MKKIILKQKDRCYIGSSDIAAVIANGPALDGGGLKPKVIKFGGDGSYYAYLVDENQENPDHLELLGSFRNWVRLYDDMGLTLHLRPEWDDKAQRMNYYNYFIYKGGDYDCIIYKQKQSE